MASPKKVLNVIKKELKELKEKYQDSRRTKVYVQKIGEMSTEDLIPEEETIITITKGGYIKRISPSFYKIQKRGGKGILGITTKGEDIVQHFLTASTHDSVAFFTASGKVFQTPVYEIPEAHRVARGRAIVNFLEIDSQERITAVFSLEKKKAEGAKYLVMVTQNGIIKKVALEKFSQVRRSGLKAITLAKDDTLDWVAPTSGEDQILLATSSGNSIRFKEKEIRSMGRTAAGIRGIRLKKPSSRAQVEGEDKVIGMDIVNAKCQMKNEKFNLLVITENGYGKRTDLKYYRLQKRGGKGIKAVKITPKTGELSFIKILKGEEDLIITSQKGQVIRMELKNISILGRTTQGVRIMRLDKGDKVASAICL